jgi:hypothetical protein
VGDGLLPPRGADEAEGDGALREGDVVGLEGLFYGDRQLGSVVATQVDGAFGRASSMRE